MKKILVVEDSKIILKKFVEYLKISGYEAVTAENGKEAVEKVQNECFDLILMDLMMPVMDGFEAIRRIRELKTLPFVPIIVISGLDTSSDIKKALDLGADEYVTKPIDGVAFNARVQAMLHLKDFYEKVMASERQYETLLQALPDVVYKLDLDGNFVFVNDCIKTMGYEPEELIGKHFSEFIHVDDVPLVSRSAVLPKYVGKATDEKERPKLFDERRTIDRATRDLEVRLAQKDLAQGKESSPGPTVTITIAYSEVDSAGQVDPHTKKAVGTVGIIKDITDRKESETIRERLVEELIKVKKELENANTRLNEKMEQMEKFQKLTMGREEKILELKERVRELEESLRD